jgi:hypothetical protein
MLRARQPAKLRSQWLWACLTVSCVYAQAAAPAVIITNLPAYGSTSNLGGMVLNTSPATCSVAAFIYA